LSCWILSYIDRITCRFLILVKNRSTLFLLFFFLKNFIFSRIQFWIMIEGGSQIRSLLAWSVILLCPITFFSILFVKMGKMKLFQQGKLPGTVIEGRTAWIIMGLLTYFSTTIFHIISHTPPKKSPISSLLSFIFFHHTQCRELPNSFSFPHSSSTTFIALSFSP